MKVKINKWTPPWKGGEIPRVSNRFSPSVETEQADVGRDGRTCLARSNSQARTGTGGIFIFPKQQIQPVSVKTEQADAGRDGRTCLARPNS